MEAAHDPFAEHLLNVQGTELRVLGRGPVLLMIHGWPDTWRLWTPQVTALRQRHTCVRFSLPGYEPGSARQAPSLAQMLGLIDAIAEAVSPGAPLALLLHDWGAFYGYQWALRRPQRVRAIVGVDVGDTSAEYMRSLPLAAKAGVAGYQGTLAAAWAAPAAVGNGLTRRLARALKVPTDPAAIHARMNYPYWQLWTGQFRQARPFEAPVPMLFVYGRRKPFMFHAPAWAARLAGRPDCAVEAFDAGHWVMLDRPDAFNAGVADWLDSIHPPPAA